MLGEAKELGSGIYKDDSYGYFWSQGNPKGFSQNLTIHWNKHRHEFPELNSQNDYYRFARSFVDNPPVGTLTKVRKNGDVLLYQPSQILLLSRIKAVALRRYLGQRIK